MYRQVVLAFDEMKIKEGLVFDVDKGNIIGFVDTGILISYGYMYELITGDLNTRLKSFEDHVMDVAHKEDEVATHMLAVCVRGIFMKLDYPIGQFPTTGIF